jgi:mannitol/fructose-specific phosphotransferase system IIA component
MFEREQIMSSAIGEGLAIPHGTESAREFVNFDQLVLLQLAKPIPWGDQIVELVIGIASKANTHVGLLSKIAQMATDGGLGKIREAENKTEILSLLKSL